MNAPFTLPASPRPPTVYSVLLNDRATQDRMAEAFGQAPYRAPPQAPVLYIKPANTHAGEGASVQVPAEPGVVQINPTLGLVMARTATRVQAGEAAAFVAGWRLCADLCLPHESVYRPAVRQRCRDGFLPMGPTIAQAGGLPAATLQVVTRVNEVEVDRRDFTRQVRPAAQLLADVTAFMTLEAGDVLMLGAADASPLARDGDRVCIEVEGLGRLCFDLRQEGATEPRP